MDDKVKRALDRRMEGVTLPAASKARILQEIEQGKDEKSVKAHRIFVATVAVAAAMMVAAAAWAGNTLQGYWGEKSIPVYEDYHQDLDTAVTQNGWKLTLDDCVSDDSYAYIGITMEAPQADMIDEDATYQMFGRIYQHDSPEEIVAVASSVEMLENDNPDDGMLSFVMWLNLYSENHSFSGIYDFVFEYFVKCADDGSKILVQPDPWVIENVQIAPPNSVVTIDVNRTVPMLDGEATLTSLEISPLSLTVNLQGGSIYGIRDRENETVWARSGLSTALHSASLNMKDGSKIDFTMSGTFDGIPVRWAGNGALDREAGLVRTKIEFDTLVDISQIESIEISGKVIPMPQ